MFKIKIIIASIILIFSSSSVHSLEFIGKFIQGHYILGKTEANSKILIDKKEVKVSKDGYFVFGIEKDRKLDIIITENKKKKKKKNLKRQENIKNKRIRVIK